MKRQNKQFFFFFFISTVRKVDYKLDPHNNPKVKKTNFQRTELEIKKKLRKKEFEFFLAFYLEYF